MKPRLLGAIIVAAVLGAMAYVAVSRWGTEGTPSEAEPPPPPVVRDDTFLPLTAEAARPRFVGELLGLFLAPAKDQFPADVRNAMDRQTSGGCGSAPLSAASSIALTRPLELPLSFKASADSPSAVACGGIVTGLNYEYSGIGANGLPATLLIARSVVRAWGVDAATDRIGVSIIGGRDVIVVRPATDEAIGQTSQVIIPETFGLTAIHAFDLNETELREVAAAVIAASQ